MACSCCCATVQAPAPSRPIERGIAGPGLLAHILVAKFADHLPLYRQAVIYARDGVDLDRALLASWVGAASALLHPLVDAIRRHVLASAKLHADDIPIPVPAPGNGKTKTARPWTYVRLRVKPDFLTKVEGKLGVIESETGNSPLSVGQAQLKADIEAGRAVTPVGKKAEVAGLTPGEKVRIDTFEVDRIIRNN
jgi:hypothetical protein